MLLATNYASSKKGELVVAIGYESFMKIKFHQPKFATVRDQHDNDIFDSYFRTCTPHLP